MPDLDTIERRITELSNQLDTLLEEVAALEVLAGKLRRIESGLWLTATDHRDDGRAHQTVLQVAEQILLDHPGPSLHYRQIAEMALSRGFRGRRMRRDTPVHEIAASFRRMMAAQPLIFERIGKGLFRLVRPGEIRDEPEETDPAPEGDGGE